MRRLRYSAAILVAASLLFVAGNAHSASFGYRPILAAPGTPCNGPLVQGCDFATGRTSINALKKAVNSTTDAFLAGVSTTSVTVATGTKVFTVDLSKTSYGVGDQVVIASAAAPSSQNMAGTVTSLVGTTLTLNITSRTGSATASDWGLLTHLPPGWLVGTSIRARTGDAVDWDFRGVGANIRVDGTTFLTISQSLFDACGWPADLNVAMIDNRSAGSLSIDHSDFDGCAYTGRLPAMIGSSASGPCPITVEYVRVTRAPVDVVSGCVGSVSIPQITFRYNYFNSTCSTSRASGFHADIFQITSWNHSNLTIHNNVLLLLCQNPAISSTTTAPLFLDLSAAFSGTLDVNNNIAQGGSYTAYLSTPVCPCSGTAIYTNNFMAYANFQSGGIFGNGNGGFLYPGAPVYPNITITGVYSAIANQQLNFLWNNGGVTTSVTHVP